MAYTELSGRKYRDKLGSTLNESVAAPITGFALAQMEKMGWSDGKGLGKQESGITTHIKASKREDEVGLGQEKEKGKEVSEKDRWWSEGMEGTMFRMAERKRRKKEKKLLKEKKTKKEKKSMKSLKSLKSLKSKKSKKKNKKFDTESSSSSSSSSSEPEIDSKKEDEDIMANFRSKGFVSDEALFEATGGVRLHRGKVWAREGKWGRAEGAALTEEEQKVEFEWDGHGKANFVVEGEKTLEVKMATKKNKMKRKIEVEVEVEVEEQSKKKKKKEKKEKKQKKI